MERQKFELKTEPATAQPNLPISGGEGIRSTRPERRRKDSARLVWDSKPKRPPSPRDIEFQTAEVVIPNPARDAATLPFSFRDGILHNEEIDRSKMNRLIWGDNLLAMQALLATGYEGKIDLIYIDPPFNSASDYSYDLNIGGTTVTKEPSVIERLAYRDTWEAGTDSYLDMLYPRLQLMKRLLSDRGSVYVHLDPTVCHYVKLLLDEVFGPNGFVNEIIWKRLSAHNDADKYGPIHDVIFFYSRTEDHIWNQHFGEVSKDYLDQFFDQVDEATGRRYARGDLTARGTRNGETGQTWRGVNPTALGNHWKVRPSELDRLEAVGQIHWPKKSGGMPRLKRFEDDVKGLPLQDIWVDIKLMHNMSNERTGYNTQKPELLLNRIIEASTDPGSIVADFFCGSGTTGAVAEKLGRRWIMSDLGKVGIQVTRGRLVQQDAKPFLIENIGNYQREMIYLTGGRIGEMQRIILKLYGATPHPTYKDLGVRRVGNDAETRGRGEAEKGAKAGSGNSQLETGNSELVYVGYPDRPTTAKKVEEVARSAETLDGDGYSRLVVLAWDYDYNFDAEWDARLKHAASTGSGQAKRPLKTDVQRRMIPPDVYDYLKKAKDDADIEKLAAKIQFHEKPYLRLAKPKVGKKDKEGNAEVTIAIERYVLFDLPVPEKEQEKLRAAMKDNFAILIDYWAVDWNYDGATFKSQWQAIRGNGKKATVVPITVTQPVKSGSSRTIAVRVVDVFGNDAAAIVTVAG